MTNEDRIIELLEDVLYEQRVTNWAAGGRNPSERPIHSRDTEALEARKAWHLRRSNARIIRNIRAAEAS